MNARSGAGLVELIVALTILGVGVLGLAAAGLAAHRAFIAADTIDRGTAAAAFVLDSLMQHAAPAAGARTVDGIVASWTAVTGAGGVTTIRVAVEAEDGGGGRVLRFEAQQTDAAAR